jgi:NADPH:quinone reductase-like Zn-dependent oxidoreductase
MMNENKGVFGLNMLSWWDREGLDRLIPRLAEGLAAGEYDPVVAASFPFDRAGEAHTFLAEGRNVGKVVLTP